MFRIVIPGGNIHIMGIPGWEMYRVVLREWEMFNIVKHGWEVHIMKNMFQRQFRVVMLRAPRK